MSRIHNAARPLPKLPPLAELVRTHVATGPAAGDGVWKPGTQRPYRPLEVIEAKVKESYEQRPFPKGNWYTLEKKTVKAETRGEHGKVPYQQDYLVLKGRGGKTFEIGKPSKEAIKEFGARLHEELSNFGGVGQLFSVRRLGDMDLGGMYPNNINTVSTYDARSGEKVTLDKLLSPAQFKSACDAVQREVKRQGKDSSAYVPGLGVDDRHALEHLVKNNFGFRFDVQGRLNIAVCIPAQIHAAGMTELQVSLFAPVGDAAFRAKAGMPPLTR